MSRLPMLALLFVASLYTLTPNVRHERVVWVSVGTLFAIGAWAVATGGYALYVMIVGAYGALYGSIGVLLVALLWGYITNLALVGGAELDAEFVRLRQLARGVDASEAVLVPVRDVSRDHWIARQRDQDVSDALAILDAAHSDGAGRTARG